MTPRTLFTTTWISAAILCGFGFGTITTAPALAGQKVYVNQPCGSGDHPSVAQVDHSDYDRLLKTYVDGQGMVAYANWKRNGQDLQALDAYLKQLGCVDLDKPAPVEAQLAYWINAYNALTLKGILREYPTRSIKDHVSKLGGYNIWDDLILVVDGREVSLNMIEHEILRPMGEPRIHFALVCASIGCPPLANEAYVPERVADQMTANGRRFLASSENFQVGRNGRTVHLSSLFDWYGEDFGSTASEMLRALVPYLPPSANPQQLAASDVRVRYLSYDWSLNDRSARR